MKLLNRLFAGRHVVVNPLMLARSGPDALCYIADTPEQMIETCRQLMLNPFTEDEIKRREKILYPVYSNRYQAQKLIERIFDSEKKYEG